MSARLSISPKGLGITSPGAHFKHEGLHLRTEDVQNLVKMEGIRTPWCRRLSHGNLLPPPTCPTHLSFMGEFVVFTTSSCEPTLPPLLRPAPPWAFHALSPGHACLRTWRAAALPTNADFDTKMDAIAYKHNECCQDAAYHLSKSMQSVMPWCHVAGCTGISCVRSCPRQGRRQLLRGDDSPRRLSSPRSQLAKPLGFAVSPAPKLRHRRGKRTWMSLSVAA